MLTNPLLIQPVRTAQPVVLLVAVVLEQSRRVDRLSGNGVGDRPALFDLRDPMGPGDQAQEPRSGRGEVPGTFAVRRA